MPSPPEFTDTFRKIRVIKIFQKAKTKNPSQTNRHIRICPKIQINLKSITDNANPSVDHSHSRLQSKSQICRFSHCISQQNFLYNPCHKPEGSLIYILCPHLSAADFPRHINITHNRTCNQLGKEHNIQGQIQNISLDLHLILININQV